jgi:uncharacterized protein (TIGR02246 family)
MAATDSPEAISQALAAAIAAGDVRAALELWNDDAKLISRDGSEVRGREAIAEVFERLVANAATLEIELRTLYEAAATAVATGTLTIHVRGPDGEHFSERSESVVVYSRDADGVWRVVIDFPWGLPSGA